MLRPLVVSTVICAGTWALAQADVYRWVDEHGQAHYSDQWMPGSTVIKTEHGRTNADAAARSDARAIASTDAKADKQLAEEANARATQADVAKQRAATCKTAKDAYFHAITARRVYKSDANGERTWMSDEDADAYREQLRKAVQDSCGSVPQFDPDNVPPDNSPPVEPKPIPEPKVNPADATSQ
jgi:hypothetical protein